MPGEVTAQRQVIDAHLVSVEEAKSRREMLRQRNTMDYLEGYFSETQIRVFYALYLWGRNWKADYYECPSKHKSKAENAPYEHIIIQLMVNWKKFKALEI